MIINICLLMAILSFNSCDENTASSYIPSQEGNDSIPATTGHLTTRSTIADVLAHPAFEGFSQYILPLEWGYDEDMPLSEVERLLPYHNYIDAERCVGYINQMIDSVAAGRRIYYDLGRKCLSYCNTNFLQPQDLLRLGSQGCRTVLLSWQAGRTVCGCLSRRRLLVCWLHPRGISPRLGVEPDGV